MRSLTDAEQATVEELIDSTSVQALLETIVTICREKADHIATSYSDEVLARKWLRAAAVVSTAAQRGALGAISGE